MANHGPAAVGCAATLQRKLLYSALARLLLQPKHRAHGEGESQHDILAFEHIFEAKRRRLGVGRVVDVRRLVARIYHPDKAHARLLIFRRFLPDLDQTIGR